MVELSNSDSLMTNESLSVSVEFRDRWRIRSRQPSCPSYPEIEPSLFCLELASSDSAMTNELVAVPAGFTGRWLDLWSAASLSGARDGGSGGGCRVAVGEWSAKGVGFREKCPGGWLGNRSVDGVTAGWDCDGAGFGWSEPLFVSPVR
ncbi:MAG: hypothetical protein ACJAQZ_004213 [Planctomycetota bacterium]